MSSESKVRFEGRAASRRVTSSSRRETAAQSKRPRVLAWLVAAALAPSLASAAGLGRLSVLSSLGQPLNAEIEIVSLQPGEGDTLKAALASQDAFRQANIDLNSALFDVRFDIDRRGGGQYVLKLSSTRPMNEPFLDMLVELNWSGGRLTREYTFLLDPPEYKAPVAAQPVTPPAVQALPAQKPPAEPPRAAAPAPAAPAPAQVARPPAAGAGTYQVKRGDTLAKIARENAQPGVSVQQMLTALYRANQDAFLGNNMNRLRAGRILNIPDRETTLAISADEARKLVNEQSSQYADFQRSVGAAVANAPERAEGTRQSSGRITAAAPEAAPAGEAPRDQLRLSKPDDAKAAKGSAASKADDASAKDKALRDAQERIAQLERNIQELEKLRTLKSGPGAQAQQQAEAKGAPSVPAAASKGEAKAPEAAKAAPAPDAKGAEAAKAPEAPKAAEPSKGEVSKAGEPAKAPEGGKAPDVGKPAPAPAPASQPKPAAAPQSVAEPSLVDELLDNPLAIGGAGAVVLLLLGYGAYAWRRKKSEAAQRFTPSVMGSAAPAAASSMLASEGLKSIDTNAASAQMDFSGGAGKVEPEEIDPVAEADVYMAYGRDAQAEEILKEALGRDPSRTAVMLKLLEIYANRKDAKAFEATARSLQGVTGGTGPEWEKAVALGLGIDPANALYGGSGESAPDMDSTQVLDIGAAEPDADSTVAVAAPPLDFDLDGGGTQPVQPDITLDAGPAVVAEAAAPTIDFDLDLGGDKPAEEAKAEPAAAPEPAPEAPAPVAAADPGAGLDFDLGLPGDTPAATEAPKAEEPAASEPPPAPEPVAAADSNVIDFDLDLPGETPAAPVAEEPPKPEVEEKAPEFDLSSITLDLGGDAQAPSAPMDAKWQEVATKLDLAKAYEEMGDKDGARDLLNEVVREGDAAQQEQAKTLLTALG